MNMMAAELASRGLGERLLHPSDVGLVAVAVLHGVGSRVAEVVARALDVERRVGDAAHGPAPILDAGHQAAHAEAERRRLDLLVHLVLAEGEHAC